MSLELDVHGYTTAMVIRTIQRCIINNPSCRCIEVIHGFNNGSRIKDLLKNKYNIHNRKVEKTLPDPFNEGKTMIFLHN